MPLQKERIRILSDKPVAQGPILYWMDRDRRLCDNWALLHAQEIALQEKQELHILFTLPDHFLDSGWRQHHFMIEGLKEVEKNAQSINIRFEAVAGTPHEEVEKYCKKYSIGAVVSDFSPLRTPRKWRNSFAKKSTVYYAEVDAHNIVPCWHASPKQEFAAYTIRPKINRLLKEFLIEFPKLKKHPHTPSGTGKTNWENLIRTLEIDHSVTPVDWCKPGEKNAHKQLKKFLTEKIKNYSEDRNDPTKDALSDLSPYIHFGQISAQRIALETIKHALDDSEAFLEELIIRRELTDNYCFYNPHYDSCKGFPEWAQKTINEHREDIREYTYSLKEFESAQTHEDLWNAAQTQLVTHGKLHGFMRMYWCKKILEWTASPEEAFKIGIYLNDKYSLDGCDPNGFVGVAWSIGGVHDRAWFERDVFGKIRYMNYNGCKRKFDVKKYIETWS